MKILQLSALNLYFISFLFYYFNNSIMGMLLLITLLLCCMAFSIFIPVLMMLDGCNKNHSDPMSESGAEYTKTFLRYISFNDNINKPDTLIRK